MVATDPQMVIEFCGAILEWVVCGELSWESVRDGEFVQWL